jgi:hypothetical protein
MLPVNAGTVTMIVAGASLIAGAGGGLDWLAATVVVYVLRSALDAWELLIEPAGTPRA